MCEPVTVLTLENSDLTVHIIPELGGKISGLQDRKTGFECFFQNPKGIYTRPALYAGFANYDASGFDDAFPNIDETWSEVNGRMVHFPDHGEVWTMPMTAQADEMTVRLQGEGKVMPYAYRKTVSLEGRSMRVSYDIENTGTDPLPFFWTMHCLVNVDGDTRLILPEQPAQAENVLVGTDLGEVGTMLDVNSTSTDLRVMPEYGAASMRKYYLAGRVNQGLCGYEFPQRGLRLMVTYDEKVLPYLGMWCTMGGFRGDVNAALEPSSAYYDSIDIARARGTLPMLQAGEHAVFDLLFTLSDMNGGE